MEMSDIIMHNRSEDFSHPSFTFSINSRHSEQLIREEQSALVLGL